ncbi:BAG family molecular chaperone regulator 1-like isoform X1 [Littorina saxatilis]|uniref:BAG family molecular chaperone regulator 1 n=1 Tax=Littorina saxatilis TaxID=31220 RepID=A0AAN9BHP5_9CAEN
MAADREGPLKIHLVHGAKNHFLTLNLPPDDCSDAITVQHLAAVAEGVSGIPPEKQKLIYKGKTLNGVGDMSIGLRAVGIKDGAKIMLLGSKPSSSSPEPSFNSSSAPFPGPSMYQRSRQHEDRSEPPNPYREDMGKLQEFEDTLSKEADNLQSIIRDLDRLNVHQMRNSTTDPNKLEQLKKRLILSLEHFMRMLESLDGLRFDSSDTASRGRRKAMVNQIHKLMDECEELASSIKRKLAASK